MTKDVTGKRFEGTLACISALLGMWAALRRIFARRSANANGGLVTEVSAREVYDVMQALNARVEADRIRQRDAERDLKEMHREIHESLAELGARISSTEAKADVALARTTELGADLKLLSPRVAMLEEESQLRRRRQ